jgi:hypothetical protein
MSKLNIEGVIKNIKSKSNIYTPIIEAVVNSIEAIGEAKRKDGKIIISVKRDSQTPLFADTTTIPPIHDIDILDNGIGFDQTNRDSFDTFYSDEKKSQGGKGFGRFMFLKYFNDVTVESVFRENENIFKKRKFTFGKEFQIITNENVQDTDEKETFSRISFNTALKSNLLDKELETIARKLVEKLLIFFINENFNCPQILLKENEKDETEIELNSFITTREEIKLIAKKTFNLKGFHSGEEQEFTAHVFKVYSPGNQKSKICLTAHNREVTEVALHKYIPEFEDDFFDDVERQTDFIRRNYIIKVYVSGDYLNQNVSLEREAFDFDKEKPDILYEFSQADIEKQAALTASEEFAQDVQVRSEKKRQKVTDYINSSAPWHKTYINDLDLTTLPYNLDDEAIEVALQTFKFKKEQKTKAEIRQILQNEDKRFEEKLPELLSKVTEAGKNDLAHYISTRKLVLDLFDDLLRRNTDGSASLEKEIHNVIFPMGKDDTNTRYENHNLWILDERLIFSQYVASDKKISKKKEALGEPDLVIFDKKQSFRGGENDFSNPLTIFEFKRPKREAYKQEDDPILQVGQYLDKIREGKYELPDGIEKIKVNDYTPVYGYIICDLTDKIKEFARTHQLTISPDQEGFFGFHNGYKIYVEILSYKKLISDAKLRNKIFFKLLGIE